MSDAFKPTDIRRRDLLKLAGSSVLLSMLGARSATGAAVDNDVTFVSDELSLTLHFTNGGAHQLHSLRNSKTGFEWIRAGTSMDPIFTAAAVPALTWSSSPGEHKHESNGDRLEFISKGNNIRANVALQTFSHAPIMEFQTEFHNISGTSVPGVTAFGPFRFALRDDLGPLQVHALRRNQYGLESIPVNGLVKLSGGAWNAPEYGGLLLLEAVGKDEFLLIGIEWERGWSYRIEKEGDGTWLSIDVTDLTYNLASGEKLPAPRVFLGLSHGDLDHAFLTARHYMQEHVFPAPLQNWPWVVYDFWATDAEGVEEGLLREVAFSAKLGIDVFNMDASWYLGSSKKGTGDWGCGLGNYADDRQKYPSGLANISHRVHEAGMKFGLWVGPNVADSRIVGTEIPKQWIAQIDGKDQTLQPSGWESSVHQVCLGCREYLDFLKKELTRIVRDFDLDWLKWDNSGIPASPAGCNRADHGHQAGDGGYAALVGQYEVFDHLHSVFPNLVLEQCGYGSRLDYGLARTIRSNWLSDASYPSDLVRNNARLASYLYPSADNGAWIVSEDEDLARYASDPAMLDTIFRSRMMSLFGFGTINGQLKERVSLYPETVLESARRHVALYKRYRHLLQHDCYHLLPSGNTKEAQWEAVQFISPSRKETVILAFRAKSAQETIQLPLQGLLEDAIYEVNFENPSRPALKMQSHDLRSKGIRISLKRPHMSEVIFLRTN
ncbi:alpha-galactosidase [Acidobacterium sp. S8]|uniref:alpha-galactosidase n=1 Tax=Acidobacterium sp. S8 TaxID=1641854 RepID=UPI00131BA26C|nr:alpha-galactosidase [Acidobacterium sp. S8]